MIQIHKNTVNKTVLTLKELTQTVGNPYLMELINEFTGVKYYLVLSNNLSNLNRFDLFEITEGTNDPLNQEIILGKNGSYTYNIYEQDDPTNLDPKSPTIKGKVETGRCNVQ